MANRTANTAAATVAFNMGDTIANEFTRFESTRIVEIAFDELPEKSKQYLVNYGLRQSLSDSFASAKDAAEFEALLDKRVTSLLEGTVGMRGGSGDPVTREAKRLAEIEVKGALRKANVTISKVDPEKLKAALAAHLEANADRLKKEAKTNLDAMAQQAVGVDLAALGIGGDDATEGKDYIDSDEADKMARFAEGDEAALDAK